jgi:hypothetical protein
MPQTIKATDAAGRWAIYVPLTRGGKIVSRARIRLTITRLPHEIASPEAEWCPGGVIETSAALSA